MDAVYAEWNALSARETKRVHLLASNNDNEATTGASVVYEVLTKALLKMPHVDRKYWVQLIVIVSVFVIVKCIVVFINGFHTPERSRARV